MISPMHILAFGFLSPLLMAAGAAATSIPIIIHLLNKRKFRVVIWAAMDFLLAAQRRNSRRLRFQRWLLLAIRCLALLILAAGIAQLILQSKAIGELFGDQKAVVILWDDSYSMGYQQGGPAGGKESTAFERSRRLIADHVASLHDGDQVMVIRASSLATANPIGKPSLDHATVISQIRAATLSDSGTNLPGAFEQAVPILKDLESKQVRTRQLILVTDLSNSSIHDPVRGAGGTIAENRVQGLDGDRLKKAVENAKSLATVSAVDVGVDSQNNVAITDLRSSLSMVVANAPAEFDVTVFNARAEVYSDVPLSLFLDGVPVQTTKIARIEPGAFATAKVRGIVVPSVGRHLLEARLPPDLLPVDDVRRLIINARREIPVLLVDGRLSDIGGHDSTALWATYFGASGLYAPKVIPEIELATTNISSYDIILFSDTGLIAPPQRDALKKFVEQGGLMVYFPGPKTSAAVNDTLGNGPTGAGLLPASIGLPQKMDPTNPNAQAFTFAPEGYAHPVLSVFADAVRQGQPIGFDLVQTSQYLKLALPVDGSSEVILRYAAANGGPGDPAVVKKDVGKGSVVLFASTADDLWNNWGGHRNFVPFVDQLMNYSLGRNTLGSGRGLTLRVGDSIDLPADFASPGSWLAPRDGHVSVSSETDKEGRAVLKGGPLTLAGVYVPPTPGARAVVAVNPDAEEADIRHVTPAQMAAKLGIDPKMILQQPASLTAAAGASTEKSGALIGPGLLIAALVLFAVESILAMLFSTYSSWPVITRWRESFQSILALLFSPFH